MSADVNQVISDTAFTIAGGDVEELLIVSADQVSGLEPDTLVKVTGIVHTKFDLRAVEEEPGFDYGDDTPFHEFDQEPYIEATNVDTTVEAEDE